jgi:hypothetical protein
MEEEIQYCNTSATGPTLGKSPLLDPSLFPVGSATFLNPNYNILPFLCNLLQVSNDETISPVLVEQPEFDITPYTDFSLLNNVGDSRVSLGQSLSAAFIYFLPRVIVQNEVIKSGGTQIINNYICDADGNVKKESQTVPVILSLDLSGEKSYKYGAIEVPAQKYEPEELLKRFTGDDITNFVKNYVQSEKNKHSEYFVSFINTHFIPAGWIPTLKCHSNLNIFYVELTLNTKKVYLKYYDDVKENVAKLLGIDTIYSYENPPKMSSQAQASAVFGKVEDYKKIMSSLELENNFLDFVLKNYLEDTTKTFSFFDSNTATSKSIFDNLDSIYKSYNNNISEIKVT